MKTTTIQIDEKLKKELDEIKLFRRETYNDIIERLLEDMKELNEQTKKEIEMVRKEIAEGKFKTHEQVRRERGF
ncbi:hypothetical protein HYY71_01385 [Candidatus Woesearchaeota archaeon]|nr:hypothetical protein [Candidatus Woesearchaeota archaeon]